MGTDTGPTVYEGTFSTSRNPAASCNGSTNHNSLLLLRSSFGQSESRTQQYFEAEQNAWQALRDSEVKVEEVFTFGRGLITHDSLALSESQLLACLDWDDLNME